jgi:predicted site-specific integrase-resolvase
MAHAKHPPLSEETREYIDIATYAYHIGVRPKTARKWISTGQLKVDLTVNGRHRIKTQRARELLKVDAK